MPLMGKATSRYNLSLLKPELAKEWHSAKNGSLTPSNVTPGTPRKVWWECEKGHEWRAMVSNRSKGKGCPYCSGRIVHTDNCLATLNPKLAKEWHPMNNGKLSAKGVTPGSNRKVWWKCKSDHEWQAVVVSRRNGVGCPYCSGRRALPNNCLQTLNPTLAREWHSEKNGSLTPEDFSLGSKRKVWWQCRKNHEWKSTVQNRNNDRGCPYCGGKKTNEDNCLATLNPKLAKEWHPTKNGRFTPEEVTLGSQKKVWWKCKKHHEWQAVVVSRSNGRRCPYCNSQTSMMELRLYTELKYVFPDTRHRAKNNKVECDVYVPSLLVGVEYDGLYWHKSKQEKDYAKNRVLENKGVKLIRVREKGLPKITGNDIIHDAKKAKDKQLVDILIKRIKKISVLPNTEKERVNAYLERHRLANNKEFINLLDRLPSPFPGSSFADKKPKLAKEWHFTKNGKLTPWDVTLGSNKRVWWTCIKKHEWQTTVAHRTGDGTGCPYCSGRRASKSNCLATLNPKLSSEWHPTKNVNLTPSNVTPGSNKKVWWQCVQRHEWSATVSDRSNGTGCPHCLKNKRRVQKNPPQKELFR